MPIISDTYEPGLAVREVSDDYANIVLITGDTPRHTTPEKVAASVLSALTGDRLPAYTVVGRDSNGELVIATKGGVAPIGITTASVLKTATDKSVPVYRAGCFNPHKLVWDASFATDEDKRLAFESTQDTIFIREPMYSNA